MTDSAFKRARSLDAKESRTVAILNSAREQARSASVREVTLTDIAAGVGMHKSTMLRYFETREEIFLHLAAQEWSEWADEISSELGLMESGVGTPKAVADLLAGTLTSRPLFCDLLAHVPLNLERGVSLRAVKSFKVAALNSARQAAEALSAAAALDEASSRNVIATATAMAGALWQMAAPGTELRALYESDPELSHAIVDVQPRLSAIVEALIVGSGSAAHERK